MSCRCNTESMSKLKNESVGMSASQKDSHDCCSAKNNSNHNATEVKDPVCGMDVDPHDSAGSVKHNGKTYHFCSDGCLTEFKSNPAAFLDEALKSKKLATAPQDAVYTCPMHPEVKQVGLIPTPFG